MLDFDLCKFELDGRIATEKVDGELECSLLFVDLYDLTFASLK